MGTRKEVAKKMTGLDALKKLFNPNGTLKADAEKDYWNEYKTIRKELEQFELLKQLHFNIVEYKRGYYKLETKDALLSKSVYNILNDVINAEVKIKGEYE